MHYGPNSSTLSPVLTQHMVLSAGPYHRRQIGRRHPSPHQELERRPSTNLLRACYEMPRTDVARICYDRATQCPVLTSRMVRPDNEANLMIRDTWIWDQQGGLQRVAETPPTWPGPPPPPRKLPRRCAVLTRPTAPNAVCGTDTAHHIQRRVVGNVDAAYGWHVVCSRGHLQWRHPHLRRLPPGYVPRAAKLG
eukprot:1286823-Rhodomonas_salina.1